jgi:hypothetical protein
LTAAAWHICLPPCWHLRDHLKSIDCKPLFFSFLTAIAPSHLPRVSLSLSSLLIENPICQF